MKKTIQLFMIAGSISAMAMMGCDNNDTSKSEDRMSTDTVTNTMMTDTTMNNMAPDTANKMMTDTATMNKSTSMAKPNPAKKGMKGRVNITGMQKAGTGSMDADKEGVYGNAEVLPSYPGGERALADYFAKNLQYPEDASSEGVEGTVNISFVVDETGHAYAPMVVSPKLGYGLEEEAMRVFNKMPVWNPGKIKGKNVKTRYTLPLSFQLY
jgi:periplasmic protein TonB